MPDISFQEAMEAVGTLVSAFEKAASQAPLNDAESVTLTYIMYMSERAINTYPVLTNEETATWERLSARAQRLLLTEPTGVMQ